MIVWVIAVASVFNTFLGIYVLLRNKRRALNRAFGFFGIYSGLWIACNWLFEIFRSNFFLQSSYAVGVFLPVFALIWISFFSITKRLKVVSRSASLIFFIISIGFFFLSYFNGYIVQLGDGKTIIPGQLFSYYGAFIGIQVITTLFIVLYFYRSAVGINRTQLRFILLGLFAWGITSILVTAVLPVFGYVNAGRLDSPSSLFFVGFSTYAIIRHRLLDIRVVLTRSIIFFFLLLYIASAFTFTSFIAGTYLQEIFGGNTIIVNLIVSVFVILGLDPIRRYISNATDSIFYKGGINYEDLTRQISETLSTEIDLQKLIETLREQLVGGLKLKGAYFLVSSQRGFTRVNPDTGDGMFFSWQSPLVQYLKGERKISVLEELYRKIGDTSDPKERQVLERSRDEIEKVGAGLVAPITAQEKITGLIVLKPKLSGDVFSQEDIQLVKVIGPQIGSAIEKSKLYEEVKSFSEKLRLEVNKAIGDLQLANVALKERNLSLGALQKISNLVTRSLNLKEIVQTIANSIATQLGYLGGIILFVNPARTQIYPVAVTETALTKRAVKLLPKPIEEYTGDMLHQHTNGILAVQTGKIQMTNQMTDAVSPPVPALIVKAIQRVLRLKSMITVPIFSEDTVIGAIHFGLAKPKEDVSQRELEMMQAVADQLGIVYRNLKLFEGIRQANDELEKANEHLRNLDQAKSEFISIASHQLRTPMTGIMGYLSMIVSGDYGPVDPKLTKLLTELLNESQRMIRLINLFLNVTKIEAGRLSMNMREVNVVDLISQEIREVLRVAAGKGIQLTFRRPRGPFPTITADPDKLADVLLNLIDNAIKYTQKGSVTVTVEQALTEVVISVTDTGLGIEPHEADALFNKFVRGSGIAKINPDGSGLGLFIAKRMVEAHSGRIWVTSPGKGKGSTFAFALPIEQPKTLAKKEKAPLKSAA